MILLLKLINNLSLCYAFHYKTPVRCLHSTNTYIIITWTPLPCQLAILLQNYRHTIAITYTYPMYPSLRKSVLQLQRTALIALAIISLFNHFIYDEDQMAGMKNNNTLGNTLKFSWTEAICTYTHVYMHEKAHYWNRLDRMWLECASHRNLHVRSVCDHNTNLKCLKVAIQCAASTRHSMQCVAVFVSVSQ